MKVDFIRSSYTRFYEEHRKEILQIIDYCAVNGEFMLRDETREFENRFAKYIGVKYCATVNSCTDAMFLSLKAMGVGPGDEVITVSHTFIATIQVIVHTGATPVLVDVGEDEQMNMDQVGDAINEKTKAIIPVHFHGKMADMERLGKIVSYHNTYNGRNIFVVEDAAQAIGAWHEDHSSGGWGKTKAGDGPISNAGCFSFNFPKILGSYGDGGAITTNNEELYKRILLLRNHWNITQAGIDQQQYPSPKEFGWGWLSRLSNINAAVLNVKMNYLPDMLKRRKEISDMYDEGLRGTSVRLPTHQDGEVVQEYVVRVKDNEHFKKFMEEQGIEVLVRDVIPNHKLPGLRLDHFNLPMTEKIAKEAVRLPIYPELRDDEVQHVIEAVRRYDDQG